MENYNRVLGYYTSKEITNVELKEISGGAVKWTHHNSQQLTGIYPGTSDAVVDQEWD